MRFPFPQRLQGTVEKKLRLGREKPSGKGSPGRRAEQHARLVGKVPGSLRVWPDEELLDVDHHFCFGVCANCLTAFSASSFDAVVECPVRKFFEWKCVKMTEVSN